ncbi:MAG: hypothetical protein JO021_09695 [Alphaproteobacteria bacterium]|nr:hypothetical protein [Alphaproteobacteria bacterium]
MASDTASITYRFHLPAGVEELTLQFDADTFTLRPRDGIESPAWAALEFSQCPHCPLTPDESPLCPFARGLAGFVERFDDFRSYEEATIEIVTETRTVAATKPLQQGMASLVGLIGATSGCPHLAFYRPMARFHLPFARDDETLYRVFTMYLLGRYLRDGAVPAGPHAMDGLLEVTQAAVQVNRSMADRVRAALDKDVVVNAVVILDMFAQVVPYVVEDGLEMLREMFGLKRPDDRA